MISDGITLTVIGMGVVFLFLIILVLVLVLSSKIISRIEGKGPSSGPAAPKKQTADNSEVAAAIAAVQAKIHS
ncbi:MAG: OadG family protein [Spirochaetales bacterium]|nr:OadG family protein [Spirochaetales bacterium]MCF7937507.1 OadG family protein [Spirochaetales bacterium]